MRVKLSLLLFISFCTSFSVLGQGKMYQDEDLDQIIKWNLLALPLRSFSFQYEHWVYPNVSVALGLRYQPVGKIPLGKTILNSMTNPGLMVQDFVNNAELGNWNVMPEVRYYVYEHKKQGVNRKLEGIYLAPFLRMGKYALDWNYAFEKNNGEYSYYGFTGSGFATTYGVLLGCQWRLAPKWKLDIWLSGPQYGIMNTKLHADVDLTNLLPSEKRRLTVFFEDVRIGGNKLTANITDYTIDGHIRLRIIGLRSGLTIGYTF